MKAIINLINRDVRDFQLLFLSSFLIFGISYLSWEISLLKILVTNICCIVTQFVLNRLVDKSWKPDSIKSAAISAFGLCILFYAQSIYMVAVCSVITIASKFIFRINKTHFINPTNAGIILTIILFGKGWISPGQWGTLSFLTFFIIGVGLMVVTKSNRLDTALTFLICAFTLDYLRIVIYQGWDFSVLLHKYTNGSIILFIFFMITDPRSTPQHRGARIFWAVILSLTTYYLSYSMQIYTAPLWALFYCSFLTPVLNYFFPGEIFEWNTKLKTQVL